MKNTQQYLKTFFEEKDLDIRSYTVTPDNSDRPHYMNTEDAVEWLVNHAPLDFQVKAAAILIQIDFANGDVHNFLENVIAMSMAHAHEHDRMQA